MAAHVAGSREAFTQLFRQLGPRVHAFFLRSFRSPAIADDLTQKTFLKMHNAREQFREDSPVRPWLFAIAARVRIDEYRRLGRAPRHVNDGLEALEVQELTADEETVNPAERAEVAERVHAALGALPETQRVVVQLHRFEGLTFREIAKILETSEGAVRVRAFRAFEKLRETLAPYVEQEETS